MAESAYHYNMGAIPDFVLNPNPLHFMTQNHVTLDFEIDTSHGDYGHPVHQDNQMLLAVWKRGPAHPHGPGREVAWASEFGLEHLLADIECAQVLVCHNAKYELGWLRRCGLDLSKVLVYCTKIGEYVLSGNLSSNLGYSTSLDACCIRRGWPPKDPVVDQMMRDGINPVRIPRPWLQGRCEQDVESTEKLFFHQREMLKERGQLALQYTRCLLTPVLADIEFNGMCLDADRVLETYEEQRLDYIKYCDELDTITGGINFNSPKQIGEYVYGELGFQEFRNSKGEPIRTAAKRPKTDSATLARLKATTKPQKDFMRVYKLVNKLGSNLSKNLEFFKGVVDENDGIFHAVFHQTVTATHRLSSSGIEQKFAEFEKPKKAQFQNLPRAFKKLFKARYEGWLFTEWDGSGLEFRGAGLVSGDQRILGDINEGRDPHSFSGSVMRGMDYEEFKAKVDSGDKEFKELRTNAKVDTFKPLYGGQSGTKAQRAYYEAFNGRYSGLVRKQEEWMYAALADKALRLPWGMTFYFPFARMESDGYVNIRTNVFNYPIQSFSTAEVIPLALVWFWHAIQANDLAEVILLVNTVHDSVLSEVHPDYVEEYKAHSIDAWDYVFRYFREVYGFPLDGIPLGTEFCIGSHWSQGEEEAWNIYPDGNREKA